MDHAANNHLVVAVSLVLAGLFLLGALRLRSGALRIVCAILIVPALVSAGWFFWYAHRPLPETARTRLFAGIDYVRDVRSTPRALVIHVVTVHLDAPGICFFVTPGGEDIPAQTVSHSQPHPRQGATDCEPVGHLRGRVSYNRFYGSRLMTIGNQ